MKKQVTINIPTYDIILTSKDESGQNYLINFMIAMKLHDDPSITKYDPKYPYVMWDAVSRELNQLTSVDPSDKGIRVDSVHEFLSHFLTKPTKREVALNSEYNAIVSKDEVKVGCQTIPISKVKEILQVANSLK